MSEKHLTQLRLVRLILAGMLAYGCSGGSETDRSVAERIVVSETSPSGAESATGDSRAAPRDAPPSEVVDAKAEESLAGREPLDAPAIPADEPASATDAQVPMPPPRTESPPPTDEATNEQEDRTSADGRLVAVADTKPGLTRVGAIKCKVCHKVQYASWVESKHAERNPPLDCESCHGSGSEYKKKSIMNDPALARAAGLVIPEESFCVGCHQDDWRDDMLERTHAHKEDEPG